MAPYTHASLVLHDVEADGTIGVRISMACVRCDDEVGIVFEAHGMFEFELIMYLFITLLLTKKRDHSKLSQLRKLHQNNAVTQLVVAGVPCP